MTREKAPPAAFACVSRAAHVSLELNSDGLLARSPSPSLSLSLSRSSSLRKRERYGAPSSVSSRLRLPSTFPSPAALMSPTTDSVVTPSPSPRPRTGAAASGSDAATSATLSSTARMTASPFQTAPSVRGCSLAALAAARPALRSRFARSDPLNRAGGRCKCSTVVPCNTPGACSKVRRPAAMKRSLTRPQRAGRLAPSSPAHRRLAP